MRRGAKTGKPAINFKDLTGQAFGRLTVLNRVSPIGDKPVKWRCKCRCGRECIANRGNLTSGNSQSCGCLNSEQSKRRNLKAPGEAFIRARYNVYRHGANRRGYVFDLAFEEFRSLCSLPCHYCGSEPQDTSRPYATRFNGSAANGVDRVDNSKGYILGNVVPCCAACNLAKGTSSVEEFLAHIRRVADFQRVVDGKLFT